MGVARWHAVQFSDTFWSEQGQSGRSDLVWSLKTRSESLGRREKG